MAFSLLPYQVRTYFLKIKCLTVLGQNCDFIASLLDHLLVGIWPSLTQEEVSH
jgi:hypothetical protein